ncbi:MAG: cell division protein FtsA, partial [Clostridia bacterium]|nr:cell division protein FtsA [Clostridia bacterium]
MAENKKYPGQLVFGLDIGTRSIVGTVGYKTGETFHVVAQQTKEHETRAMLDGQIHDIAKVGKTIKAVKETLERQIDRKLKDVCIAAAGRVLKTVTTHVDYEFSEETVVLPEHIYTLDMLGVEKAYDEFQLENHTGIKFYCVGYSVMKYYLNQFQMTSLESHKARTISADLIATFLPDEVVDGLYRAVEVAQLQVVNLTLEPIAAIQVAIPTMYRMLNIALVDVGAGTSDISITRDGSIVAYGMIPSAGDKITEVIARHCLVDFNQAEKIKIAANRKTVINYKDIMGLSQKISPQEVAELIEDVIQDMAHEVAEKIIELNGGKPVSAVFIVGGGGKCNGYSNALARELGIQEERVAVRGEEVLKDIDFMTTDVKRDSMYVTPIGICLNFYDQKNNFIFVNFNGERIKLYDNNKLAIVDAAMQANFPNEGLFPRRGEELHFCVNGKNRMVRGELGEPAVVTLNGVPTGINAPIVANDKIVVKESSYGAPAKLEIRKLPEYDSSIQVIVNDQRIVLPKFAEVNGTLQSGYYEIQNGDEIKMLNYYTAQQIVEFMDVILKEGTKIYINNKLAGLEDKVYENFSVIWTMEDLTLSDIDAYEDSKMDEKIEEYFDETYAASDENVNDEDAHKAEDAQKTETA